jgi:hypothetical protein
MKLIETNSFGYKFETGNGCTFTRERLKPCHIAYELDGWYGSRSLYELTEHDRITFPEATHRIALRQDRSQDDPFFVTVPCWIKKGTKHQLQYISDDDEKFQQAKIKKVYDFS